MREISSFNRFVNPFVKIDPKATAVNGISQAFVEKLDGWNVVGAEFNDWIDMQRRGLLCPVTMVGHNSKRFDSRILTFEHNRHDLGLPKDLHSTDTLQVFRDLHPGLENYKLGSVYHNAFKENIPDQHTAEGDVRAMQRLLGTASPEMAREKLLMYSESWDCIVKRCMKL